MTEVAVVGIGGWGKNLARNYFQIADANLRYVCDLDKAKLDAAHTQYPGVRAVDDFATMLDDPELDAVVIATTAPTHYRLAKSALQANKDVYVEKPFVLDVTEAEELIKLAEEKKKDDSAAQKTPAPAKGAPAKGASAAPAAPAAAPASGPAPEAKEKKQKPSARFGGSAKAARRKLRKKK